MNGIKVYQHDLDWECSNFIGDEFIVTSHTIPNKHETTKLYKVNVKTKVRKPFLHQWCKDNKMGLEDAYWLKINGDEWVMAEAKKWGGSQEDIAVFKNEQFLFYIKPTSNHWENYSVSSPTFFYNNNTLQVYYEGRYKSNVNDYKTGMLLIDTNSLSIGVRSSQPIMNDRLVPDDYRNNKLSGHRQDIPYQSKWKAVIYKYVNGQWIKDSEPKDQDGSIGEYYFDNHYWKSNQDGMWKFVSQPPTNGGSMPQIKLENDILSVTNAESGEQYAWNVRYTDGKTAWFAFGESVGVRDKDKTDGNKFWCYPMSDSSKLSNFVTYEEDAPPIIPPTGDNEQLKQEIIDLANQIITKVGEIK